MDFFKKKTNDVDERKLKRGKLFLKRRFEPESLFQIYKVSFNTMKHWERKDFNQFSDVFFDVYIKYLNDSLGEQHYETNKEIVSNIRPALISLFQKKLKEDFKKNKNG